MYVIKTEASKTVVKQWYFFISFIVESFAVSVARIVKSNVYESLNEHLSCVKIDVQYRACLARKMNTSLEEKLRHRRCEASTAAKPRVLCQAENVFSRAATEEGSTEIQIPNGAAHTYSLHHRLHRREM